MLRASPRRAWLTLSLMVETLLRRPARASARRSRLALMHKHLYEYMRDTCRKLEEVVQEIGMAKALPDGA